MADSTGAKVTLSSFWSKGRIVIVFLRHFGCPFCREQVVKLRDDFALAQSSGLDIVCIGQGSYKTGKGFSIYFNLPFPVLVTEDDNSVYKRYGLLQGTPKQLFGIDVILRGLSALRHGMGAVEGDATQMPGIFVVDTNGTVLLARRAASQADNLSVQQILNAIK